MTALSKLLHSTAQLDALEANRLEKFNAAMLDNIETL